MNEDVNIEAIALKQWHRKYGLFAFASMPDTKIIMQLLKLSEADKQRADMCKQVVEDYLEKPFVTEKDLES